MRYRGRSFSEEEIEIIRQIIKDAPEPKYRRQMSKEICRRLNWTQPSGGLKDMAARVALLEMEKDGLIVLPPLQAGRAQRCHLINRKLSYKHVKLAPLAPLCSKIQDLHLEFLLVGKQESQLWNAYVDQYHYLGYAKLGGAQLRYIIRQNMQPIALFGFSAAAWKVKPRDEFIGWNAEQKERNLNLVINNSRFLILPSIEVPHLASHLLAKIAKRLPEDWNRAYHYKPVLLETFVQKDRFKGTCYRAANWIYLGDTKGRGKFDVNHRNAAPVKSIWVYPLEKQYQRRLR